MKLAITLLGILFSISCFSQESVDAIITLCNECKTLNPNDEECCNWFEDLDGNILGKGEMEVCDDNIPFIKYITSDCVNRVSEEIWAIEVTKEICGNGIDDDCDGLDDCHESECIESFVKNNTKSLDCLDCLQEEILVNYGDCLTIAQLLKNDVCGDLNQGTVDLAFMNESVSILNDSEICINKCTTTYLVIRDSNREIVTLEEVRFFIIEDCCNNVDDDCDGLVDTFDDDCSSGNCSCFDISISERMNACGCSYDLFVNTGVDGDYSYEWNVIDAKENSLEVKESGIYSVTVTNSEGVSCEASYAFDADGSFYVQATGKNGNNVSVKCTTEKNTLIGDVCDTDLIELKLFSNKLSLCRDKIEWFVTDDFGNRSLAGTGQSIPITSDSEMTIEVLYCGNSILEIEKTTYVEFIRIYPFLGCNSGQTSSVFGQDEATIEEFREAGFYDNLKFLNPTIGEDYAPVISLLKGKSINISFNTDISKDIHGRDPNFYFKIEANNISIGIDDEIITFNDLTLYDVESASVEFRGKVKLTANDGVIGGNAANPYDIDFVDNCGTLLSKVKVATGVSQEIRLILYDVPIKNESGVWEYSPFPLAQMNEIGFSHLFRELTIVHRESLFLDNDELERLLWWSETAPILIDFYDLIEIKTGVDPREFSSPGNTHSEFIYFNVNMTNNSWEGFSLPAKGTYSDIKVGGIGAFFKADMSTIIHEIGHGLKLCHPFHSFDMWFLPDCWDYTVLDERGTTCGFMDYTNSRLSFFYHEWLLRL